jgi:hypothetical protein
VAQGVDDRKQTPHVLICKGVSCVKPLLKGYNGIEIKGGIGHTLPPDECRQRSKNKVVDAR